MSGDLVLALTELTNDDDYLLAEVREQMVPSQAQCLEELIETVTMLVRANAARCSIAPVLGAHRTALSLDDAIHLLAEPQNWDRPGSDSDDAVWLTTN